MVKRNRGTKNKKGSRCKAAVIVGAACTLAFLLEVADRRDSGETYIERKEPGEGSQEKEYILKAKDVLTDYPWSVTAMERQYTKSEKEAVIKSAQKELEELIVGENENLEEINKDLYLPETLQNGVVEVSYYFSDYKTFYPDGTIRKLPAEGAVVVVSAEMECQGESFLYELGVRAVPQKKGAGEQLADKIADVLAKENEKTGKDRLILPKEVGGIPLSWKEKRENRSLPVVVLGIVAAGCILTMEKEKEKKQRKEREQKIQTDYPEILGKLILLMGAGMNVAAAWKLIAGTYRSRRDEKKTLVKPAYEEMLTTVYEMQEGIGEVQAYENFGQRCRIAECRKLSAILVQNVKKGNAEIRKILEAEKIEAYEKQKARVKVAGEEAGTKLLLPMLLMLLVVLIIIMVPAGMSMQV